MAVGVVAGVAAVAIVALATRKRPPIQVSKSIEIDASPEEVFDVWSEYENFPRFMSRVDEVRALGADRSHWKVKGPADVPIEWDSVVTARERGRLLAWHSEPGSGVEHAGRVELVPCPAGTRATVSMSYRPPGNRLGHLVASLFGRNPKQDLDHDLACMKAFVEGRKNRLSSGNANTSGVVQSPQPVGTLPF